MEFKLPSITKPSFRSGPALDVDLSISLPNIGSYVDTNRLQVKCATLEDYVAAEKSDAQPITNMKTRLSLLTISITTCQK